MYTTYTKKMVRDIKRQTKKGDTRATVATYMTDKYNTIFTRNAIIGKVFRLRAEGDM